MVEFGRDLPSELGHEGALADAADPKHADHLTPTPQDPPSDGLQLPAAANESIHLRRVAPVLLCARERRVFHPHGRALSQKVGEPDVVERHPQAWHLSLGARPHLRSFGQFSTGAEAVAEHQ